MADIQSFMAGRNMLFPAFSALSSDPDVRVNRGDQDQLSLCQPVRLLSVQVREHRRRSDRRG